MRNIQKQKGFSLLEVSVASAIFASLAYSTLVVTKNNKAKIIKDDYMVQESLQLKALKKAVSNYIHDTSLNSSLSVNNMTANSTRNIGVQDLINNGFLPPDFANGTNSTVFNSQYIIKISKDSLNHVSASVSEGQPRDQVVLKKIKHFNQALSDNLLPQVMDTKKGLSVSNGSISIDNSNDKGSYEYSEDSESQVVSNTQLTNEMNNIHGQETTLLASIAREEARLPAPDLGRKEQVRIAPPSFYDPVVISQAKQDSVVLQDRNVFNQVKSDLPIYKQDVVNTRSTYNQMAMIARQVQAANMPILQEPVPNTIGLTPKEASRVMTAHNNRVSAASYAISTANSNESNALTAYNSATSLLATANTWLGQSKSDLTHRATDATQL